MRLAAKVDDNHKAIVNAFRSIGCSVSDTSRVGKGFPDIVVGFNGKNYLIEIKDGGKPKSGRQLRPAQEDFKDAWRGQYTVVESVGDVLIFRMAFLEGGR